MVSDTVSLDEARLQDEQFQIAGPSVARLRSTVPQPFYESTSLMISDFNRIFIQVLIDNYPSVIWEHDNSYTIFNYENFYKQFSYSLVGQLDLFDGRKVSSAKATRYWLDSHKKRTCPGIKFWPSTTAVDPEDPENKFFNKWKDWPLKSVENKTLARVILMYVYRVSCSSNRVKFNHIMDFYGHMLQKPEQKPSFGIATRGDEEGTGKSTLTEEMQKIVGKDNSFSTADPEDIFSRNNPGMDCCLLLELEEAEWAKYKRYGNKLRNLFTTPIINICDKWEKQTVQNNFTRIVINGNAEHIMHVSRTGRRLTIFDVNPIYAGNTEYFAKLKHTFDNGGREALMYYLLHRDISNFNPFKPLHTKEMDEQKELSLNDVSEFWLDECLDNGTLPYEEKVTVCNDRNEVARIYYKVIVEKLVWCFNEWAKRRGGRAISTKAFGRQFRKIVPEMRPAHDVKVQPEWIRKQFNCFEIREIGKCREFFISYQGWKHKTWDGSREFEMLEIDKSLWYKGW